MSFLQVNSGAPKPWGKLISINSNLKNIDLVASAYKIGRNSTNDIPISDVRISGNHCILTKADNGSVTIQDLSSNGTFIDDQKIGKGKSKLLVPGNRFTLLPASKIPDKDLLGYIFSMGNYHTSPIKRQREEAIEEHKIQNTKQIKPPSSPPKEGPTKEELEKNKCLLCNNYLYQCITTVPCRHSFCGACYCSSVGVLPTCPECYNEVKELQRNKTVDENVQKFLEKYPQYKRKPEDMTDMNKRNKFPNGHVFSEPENPKPQQRQEQRVVQQDAPQQRQQQQQQPPKPNVSQIKSPTTGTVSAPVENVRDPKAMPKIQRYHLLMSKFTAE